MARAAVTWMPRIPKQVKIGHIPQRLKNGRLPFHRARLEVLRKMMSALMREERSEFRYYRALELRPYVERLLQYGLYRGPDDEYTKEMVDWWIMDGDIREKFFEVYVPRFRDQEGPYTRLYKLQNDASLDLWEMGVIELKGNPYPPVITNEPDYSHNLLNILLRNAIIKQLDVIRKLAPNTENAKRFETKGNDT